MYWASWGVFWINPEFGRCSLFPSWSGYGLISTSSYEEISAIWSKMSGSLCVKYPLFLSDFNGTWNFLAVFFLNRQMSNFTKIRPVDSELFHVDRWIVGDMTQLLVAFHNFANAPKNKPFPACTYSLPSRCFQCWFTSKRNTTRNFSKDSWYCSQDSNGTPLTHKWEELLFEITCSVLVTFLTSPVVLHYSTSVNGDNVLLATQNYLQLTTPTEHSFLRS